MRTHINIRKFLNRSGHHAGAYVFARVGDSESCTTADCDHRWCTDIELTLADCSRIVHFDFEVATAAQRRNSLHKADLLVDALTDFRDALRIEADRAARRPRRSSAPDLW